VSGPAGTARKGPAGLADGPIGRICDMTTRLTDMVSGVASIWIFALMVLICADVIGRTIFNAPVQGVAEIVAHSIVAIVFLQVGYVLMRGRLTRTEMLIGNLEAQRPAAAALLSMLFHATGLVCFALIAIGTWPNLAVAWTENEFFGAQGVFTAPVWPIKACLFIGSLLTCLAFAVCVLRDLATAVGGRVRAGPPAAAGNGKLAAMLVVLAGMVATGYLLGWAELSNIEIGIATIVFMLLLIFSGAHIAVTLIVLSFIGIWLIRHNPNVAIRSLALAADGSIKSYLFGVVPLFVLMGLLVDVADIGRDAFRVAAWLLQRVRGGLGMATVAASAVFASITGISIASAAVFARVAVPQMVANGYNKRFALGVVAGSSVLGMLIPPSLLLIIYAVLAEESVGGLFLAAIIPGLILAGAFGAVIYGMARLRPRMVMQSDQPPVVGDETVLSAFLKALPIIALVFIVLGGIYSGVFTPTEAGGAGAAAALLVALARRKLDWRSFWGVLVETGLISASILILIIAASMYSRMLTLSTIPMQITGLFDAAGLGLAGFLVIYVLIVLVMGMVLDSTSIMLVVLPLALPIVSTLDGNLIWFGVITVIAVEVGLLTPPFGLTVYVVKSTISDETTSLSDIFIGALPFVIVMLAVTFILAVFPALSLVFE
jgi:tripartite ATP-independent transporter DctM subunit